MIGTIRWNIGIGICGFLLTFAMSIGDNYVLRVLLHALYSFLILFVIVFGLRWVLGSVVGLKGIAVAEKPSADAVGTAFDAATPDDQDQLNDMLKQQLNGKEAVEPFLPLQPKKLSSVPSADPQQLAQALRQMNEQ
ncbi:MAG: hypothetical protein K0Q59_1093 [Paenibacillus sp.]|nr:hypothetical protein [Paenibacillus sp.]